MIVVSGQFNVALERVLWRRIWLPALMLVPIISACDATDLLVPRGSIRIEPASNTVMLQTINNRTGFVVPVTISNTSEKTVYYSGGCGWRVEQSKLMGDEGPREWVTVFFPLCALELPPGSPPVAIDPGQVLAFTIDTRGSGLGPSTVFDGQYRVSFDLAVMRFGELRRLPHDQSVSTPFTVVAN
jgi:hypothetical protein